MTHPHSNNSYNNTNITADKQALVMIGLMVRSMTNSTPSCPMIPVGDINKTQDKEDKIGNTLTTLSTYILLGIL